MNIIFIFIRVNGKISYRKIKLETKETSDNIVNNINHPDEFKDDFTNLGTIKYKRRG